MRLLLIRWHGPKGVDQEIVQTLLPRKLWHDDGTVLGLSLAMYIFIYQRHLELIVKLLLFWQFSFGARLRRLLPIRELIVPR